MAKTKAYLKQEQLNLQVSKGEIAFIKDGFSAYCKKHGVYDDSGQRRTLRDWCVLHLIKASERVIGKKKKAKNTG